MFHTIATSSLFNNRFKFFFSDNVVNHFQTGATSGSRGGELMVEKKKYIYILYLFKIFTFIFKKIEAIKLILV